MVIVLPGEHLTVGVISTKKHREEKTKTHIHYGLYVYINVNHIKHITIYCSGIYLEDRNARKDEKNPIMKSHQV